MARRGWSFLFLSVFLSFLLATLLVNFFHTEKSLDSNGSCPACHLQKTALAEGLTLAVILPRLTLVEILPIREAQPKQSSAFFDLVSRSPPQA